MMGGKGVGCRGTHTLWLARFYNAPSLQCNHGTGYSGLRRKMNIEDLPPCAVVPDLA